MFANLFKMDLVWYTAAAAIGCCEIAVTIYLRSLSMSRSFIGKSFHGIIACPVLLAIPIDGAASPCLVVHWFIGTCWNGTLDEFIFSIHTILVCSRIIIQDCERIRDYGNRSCWKWYQKLNFLKVETVCGLEMKRNLRLEWHPTVHSNQGKIIAFITFKNRASRVRIKMKQAKFIRNSTQRNEKKGMKLSQ